jgi:hypothetical protein
VAPWAIACIAAAVPFSTTVASPRSPEAAEIGAIAAAAARHPQDGPHVDLRLRSDAESFVASISMNLVFLDWMLDTGREDPERIDASELPRIGAMLSDYFAQQMPVSIDGVRVPPRIEGLEVNDPDPVLLPLFPLSGWQGLRKIAFELVYPLKSPPQTVSVVWPAYPPDLLSPLPTKPPLEIAAEWTADGLRTQVLFTRAEPEHVWHRPAAGIAARLETVPAPPAPRPLVPPFATLAVGVFVVSFVAAAAARRRPATALATGLVAAGVVLVIRPSGPAILGFGTRAPRAIDAVEAARAFESLQANIYRAFDYEDESTAYDALSASVGGDLLERLYLDVRRTLVMEEEGGAMSRVVAVRPVRTEIESQGEVGEGAARRAAFVVAATWQVDGRVTHWGHAHERTVEYDGRFVVEAQPAGWRIGGAEITRQERVDSVGTEPDPLMDEDAEL